MSTVQHTSTVSVGEVTIDNFTKKDVAAAQARHHAIDKGILKERFTILAAQIRVGKIL